MTEDDIAVLAVGGRGDRDRTDDPVAALDDDRGISVATAPSVEAAEGSFDCLLAVHDPPRADAVETLDRAADRVTTPVVVLDRSAAGTDPPSRGGSGADRVTDGAGVDRLGADGTVPGRVLDAGAAEYVRADAPAAGRLLVHRVRRAVSAARDRTAAERFGTVAETIGDAVYALDDRGRFVYVNEAFADLTGYEREEVLGEPPTLIKSDETYEEARWHLARALSEDGPDSVQFEMEVQPREGDPVPCEDHMAPLLGGGEFRGSAGVLRDISDHVERERELERQRDRLDEFASVVSHDLRSPIEAAYGHVELLARELDAEDGADADGESPHLDGLREQLGRMDDLVESVLTLARGGDAVGATAPVDLSSVVDAAWSAGGTAEVDLAVEDRLPTVDADRSRLSQLLENLFRNARDHGGEDVTVRVGALDDADGFFVADDGPGIPPEDRDRIFESGYTTAGSTGIGLSIVRTIAEGHGWTVEVTESAEGGARFEVHTDPRPP